MQLVTEKKAAEIMAVPAGTLRYWRCQGSGRGPDYVRLGGRIKYDLAEIQSFVEKRRHGDLALTDSVSTKKLLSQQKQTEPASEVVIAGQRQILEMLRSIDVSLKRLIANDLDFKALLAKQSDIAEATTKRI